MFMGIYVAQRSVYSPTYTSSATLVVRAKNGTTSTSINLSVSADMARIYAAVFQESSMKALAAENLGMEHFEGNISISVVEGINLMTVSVTADDPELAYHLLSSMLEVYPQISEAVFSNAVIDIMIAPQMPDAPSNQISMQYRGLLILAAMAVQTCLIVLLSLLRETVKHERAFEQMVEGKLLGAITHERPHLPLKSRLAHRKGALLINSAFSSLRFSEDYQKIATKLEYFKKNQDATMFAITSVAKNEGKSTIAANIALALSERGYRVVLIDLDLRKPSLYKILGYHEVMEQEFSDVLSGKIPTQDYRLLQYKNMGLFLALSKRYRGDAADWLGSDCVKGCLSDLRTKVDFVMIDTPPTSASADAAGLIRLADRAILVVRTDRATAADINDTIATLSNVGGNLAGCILNDVYKTFTFFGQMGTDESGAYRDLYGYGKRYGGYGKMTVPAYGMNKKTTPEATKRNGRG